MDVPLDPQKVNRFLQRGQRQPRIGVAPFEGVGTFRSLPQTFERLVCSLSGDPASPWLDARRILLTVSCGIPFGQQPKPRPAVAPMFISLYLFVRDDVFLFFVRDSLRHHLKGVRRQGGTDKRPSNTKHQSSRQLAKTRQFLNMSFLLSFDRAASHSRGSEHFLWKLQPVVRHRPAFAQWFAHPEFPLAHGERRTRLPAFPPLTPQRKELILVASTVILQAVSTNECGGTFRLHECKHGTFCERFGSTQPP